MLPDRHGLAQGECFEFLAQPSDLLEVRQRDRSDTIAAVVLELDQAVGDQAGQRLPKGTQADSEAFPHPMQIDLASGLELPGDDCLPQPIDELARDRILMIIDQVDGCRRVREFRDSSSERV